MRGRGSEARCSGLRPTGPATGPCCRRLWLWLAFAAPLLPSLAWAESPPEAPVRPGPLSQPTRVAIGVYLLDVSEIDDARQTLRLDFMLWLHWQDGRLASARAGHRRVPPGDVWNPRIQIINERSLENKLPDLVDVDADGGVLYVQRISGTISSSTDLADFPFDEQVFQIRTIAGGFAPEEVDLVIEPGRTGRAARLSIADWDAGPLTAENFLFDYTADGRVFPGCAFAFVAKRHSGFYLWKVVLPLVIVVLMSWTVFWIDPSTTGAQVAVAATSILALIAYQFVLGDLVPRLSYLTRQDRFLIGSMFLVFLALVEVVTTSAFARQDRLPLAQKIDRWARVVFPLAFLLLILIAFRL